MTSKQSKTSLLSDKLEFEDVSKPRSELELDLPEEIMQALADDVVKVDGEAQGLPQGQADTPKPAAAPVKSGPAKPVKNKNADTKKSSDSYQNKDEFSDKFARHAAILALLGLMIILSSTFIYKRILRNDEAPGYVVLPQGVANIDGQIIRMQITIQVRDADKEWLIENKRILSDLFQIELAKLDLKELKTEQELEQARARMRDNLNAAMATDKIEAVLINEFLSQNKD